MQSLPEPEDIPETIPGVPQHIVDSMRRSLLDIREGRVEDARVVGARMQAKIDAYIEAGRLKEPASQAASVSGR